MGISAGPDIIDSGLVLELDAADRNSYPGSGTAWKDLSPNGYTGTLTNGPTFGTANQGSIVFDGTNDYVELNTTNIISGTNPFTIDCFFSLDGGTYGELFGNYGAGYGAGYVWFATAGLYIDGSCYVPDYTTATQGKHHIVATRNASGACIVYLDGVSVATATLTSSVLNTPNFRMGADTNSGGGAGSELLNGKIYNIKVYNRALTASEVLQNYNQMKTRFGL